MKNRSGKKWFGRLWLTAGLIVALCAACGDFGDDPSAGVNAGVNDGGNPGKPNAGTDGGDEKPATDGIVYRPVKANVMLLVDRSGSMAEPADCGLSDCPSKWEQLLSLGVYLTEAKQLASLGLAVFPSPQYNGCSVSSSVLVPLSDDPDVDEQIMNAIANVSPGGRTPVAAALDEMRKIKAFQDPTREHSLVILTDGRPNCACSLDEVICERDAAVAAVKRLENSDPHVDIDVIGFGASARDAEDTLNAMAAAASDPQYYQSDTIEELISFMYKIGVEKTPCTFDLDELPDQDRLIVWFDDVQLPPCDEEPCASGYTYDQSAGTVEFQGSTCEALRDGEKHDIWFDELE